MVYKGQSEHAYEDFRGRSPEWCVMRGDEGLDAIDRPCFESLETVFKSNFGNAE